MLLTIPDEYKDTVESAYQELVEAAAEGDDALLKNIWKTVSCRKKK